MKKKNVSKKASFGKPFYSSNIGINTRRLRMYHNIKQDDFAKILGVSRQMLSHYENNKYPVPEEIVSKIILYFKTDLNALLAEKN